MSETLTIIGKKLAKERLKKFLCENNVPIAHTYKRGTFAHSVKDDDGEEVEEFMELRKEWRKENRERSLRICQK